LKSNKSLIDLNFSKNWIKDEGGRAFADMLKENNTIEVLNLNFCGLKEESNLK